MREIGVVRRRAVGDPDQAAPYYGLARTLLGRMKAALGAGIAGSHVWALADGTQIRTTTGPQGDTVEVYVTGGGVTSGCLPLINKLFGFVFNPGQSGHVYKVAHDEEEGFSYSLYVFNADDKMSSTSTAKFYEKKIVDTCGKQEDWYSDVVVHGNTSWFGREEDGYPVLSWTGGMLRYKNDFSPTYSFGNFPPISASYNHLSGFLFSTTVFYRGNVVKYRHPTTGVEVTLSATHFSYSGMTHCSGAAIHKNEDGSLVLVYCAAAGTGSSGTATTYVLSERVYYVPILDIDDTQMVVGDPVLKQSLSWTSIGAGRYNLHSWLFNASGTEAVCIRIASDSKNRRYVLSTPVDNGAIVLTEGPYISTSSSQSDSTRTVTTASFPDPGGPTERPVSDVFHEESYSETIDEFADYIGDTMVLGQVISRIDTVRDFTRNDTYTTTDGDTTTNPTACESNNVVETTMLLTVRFNGVDVITVPGSIFDSFAMSKDGSEFGITTSHTEDVIGSSFSGGPYFVLDMRVGFASIEYEHQVYSADMTGPSGPIITDFPVTSSYQNDQSVVHRIVHDQVVLHDVDLLREHTEATDVAGLISFETFLGFSSPIQGSSQTDHDESATTEARNLSHLVGSYLCFAASPLGAVMYDLPIGTFTFRVSQPFQVITDGFRTAFGAPFARGVSDLTVEESRAKIGLTPSADHPAYNPLGII